MAGASPHADIPEDAMSVLQFWFGELMPANWFSSSDQIDATIERRFAGLHSQAESAALDHWGETPRGLLALIIVLDQFSRNIHRNSGKAFANDAKAQSLTLQAIDREFDMQLGMDERQFLYMPLMHAEDRALQSLGVEKYASLVKAAQDVLGFAHAHQSIIEKFGRFPYRNPMLGRTSEADERAFMEKEGNPFS